MCECVRVVSLCLWMSVFGFMRVWVSACVCVIKLPLGEKEKIFRKFFLKDERDKSDISLPGSGYVIFARGKLLRK